MKKLLLTLGAAGATLAPLATVVACGSETTVVITDIETHIVSGYSTLLAYEAGFTDADGNKVAETHVTGSVELEDVRNEITTMLPNTDQNLVEHNFTFDISSSRWNTMEHNDDFWAKTPTEANFSDGNAYADYTAYEAANEAAETKIAALGIDGTNLIYTVEASDDADNKKDIIIGAHYDLNNALAGTTGTGTNDNNTGVAATIALANYFEQRPLEDYNLIFGFWDAEENGIHGSLKYAESLEADDTEMYINLDSIAGGDHVYFGYGTGQDDAAAIYEEIFADKNIMGGKDFLKPHVMERTNWGDDFETGDDAFGITEFQPEGEMYEASDHNSFVENGIKSLGFESTNYEVFGTYGRDGYSQTDNASFWYTAADKAAGSEEQAKDNVIGGIMGEAGVNPDGDSRNDLENDGRIWHTEMDSIPSLRSFFGDRVEIQMDAVTSMVATIIANYDY